MVTTKHEECLGFVAEILSVLKSTHQHEKVLHLIVDRLVRMYHCQTCAIILVDPSTEYLNVALAHGLSHTFSKEFRRTLATGAIGQLLWTGKPIVVQNSAAEPALARDVQLEHPYGSAVCVQISANHRSLGYLHVDSAMNEAFTQSDIRVLQTFADFAAVALHSSRLFEENLHLDTIDHETELEKYAPFLERLKATMERSRVRNESFSLLILDVDNFKHIASTYGSDSSREMLRQIGAQIRSKLRPIDAIGRHGFDEFIVLRSNAGLVESVLFADELRQIVDTTSFTSRGIRTSVSVGVAVYPRHASDLEGLLQCVKEALFDAQRGGRNKVTLFGSEQIPESERTFHD
ncbi:MAG TPA: sensor domain-containing diguanylate cyclase [Bacteroidota bacterium]|nr:sensor domain-containing diguanylate cyclase [Bacteroidota bacterium]